MPSSLGSFTSGFWDDIDKQREENYNLERDRTAMERSVLTSLLNSPDDKVRSYAVAGLLDSAGPKRHMKGLRGLVGEFETNPSIQQIHQYLSTPQTTVTPGLPSTNLIPTGPTSPGSVVPKASSEGGFNAQGPLPVAPKQGAAAMPTTTPVQGGALRPATPAPQRMAVPTTGGPQAVQVGAPPPRPSLAGKPVGSVPGQQQAGNLNLFNQPSVPNPEAGGQSTVYSTSFNDDRHGRGEVLVSRVGENGQILSEDQAKERYYQTGQHLGIFDSPESATAYAQQLHNEYASGMYGEVPETEQAAPGTGAAPTAGVVGTPPPTVPPAQPGVIRQEHKGPAVGRTDTTYPQAFDSPDEALRRAAVARAQGDTEGDIAGWMTMGLSREQAIEQVKAERMRSHGGMGSGSGYQAIQGTMPGSTQPVWGVFDRAAGQFVDPVDHHPLQGFNARVTSASSSMGSANEAMARAMFGQPFTALAQEQQMDVLAAVRADAAAKAGGVTTARADANAVAPLSTEKQFEYTHTLQQDWQTVSKPVRGMRMAMDMMNSGMEAVKAGHANPGSQAILVPFQKMLDQISVVRESEYLRSAVGQNIWDRFDGLYQRYLGAGGAGIPEEDLPQFVELGQSIMDKAEAALEPEKKRIVDTATGFKLDPARIIPGYTPPTATPGAVPPPAAAAPAATPVAVPPKAAPAAPVEPATVDQSKLTGTPVSMETARNYAAYRQKNGDTTYTVEKAIAQYNKDGHPVTGQ